MLVFGGVLSYVLAMLLDDVVARDTIGTREKNLVGRPSSVLYSEVPLDVRYR